MTHNCTAGFSAPSDDSALAAPNNVAGESAALEESDVSATAARVEADDDGHEASDADGDADGLARAATADELCRINDALQEAMRARDMGAIRRLMQERQAVQDGREPGAALSAAAKAEAEEVAEARKKAFWEHAEHMRGLMVHVATICARERGPTVLVTDPPAEWTVADLQERQHYKYQAMLL